MAAVIVFDWRLLPQEDCRQQGARVRSLCGGILTKRKKAEMRNALDAIAADHASEAGKALVRDHPSAEDIHHFVELTLAERIGPLGLKLHTGRSRNEQIATDLRLYVRAQIDYDRSGSRRMGWRSGRAGARAGDSVMPSYTHLQRAEPVLVAHWLLAYVEMALARCDAAARLCEASQSLPARLGRSGRRNACARPHHRCAGIGFTAPTANSIDATSDRDFILEYLQALTLRRSAPEPLCRRDYASLRQRSLDSLILPEAFSTGSSAMPQKKNPDLTELIRAKVGRIQRRGAGRHAATQGTASGLQ